MAGDHIVKTRYRYEIGTGSWHQRKAGNYISGVLIVDHTPEEHETFMRNYNRQGESVVARIIPTPHEPRPQ
jgi:hypothetical protein